MFSQAKSRADKVIVSFVFLSDGLENRRDHGDLGHEVEVHPLLCPHSSDRIIEVDHRQFGF